MAEATQFTIGAEATCTDGTRGEVIRVVVDPVARVVTHLVIEPKHRRGLGRLVPLGLVDVTTGGVRLLCTGAEFEKLASAEETQFLLGGYEGYGPGQVLAWPYFGLGGGMALGGSMGFGGGVGTGDVAQAVTYDTVPLGEVAVRRGQQVHATDGDIGSVQGLVIDTRTRHVTHVLLQEGHRLGRKEVAIPIAAVAAVGEDGIHLHISKQDVQDLPSVTVDYPKA